MFMSFWADGEEYGTCELPKEAEEIFHWRHIAYFCPECGEVWGKLRFDCADRWIIEMGYCGPCYAKAKSLLTVYPSTFFDLFLYGKLKFFL